MNLINTEVNIKNIKNEEKDNRYTKVICFPGKKIFNSLKEASEYCGVKTTSGISLSCKYPFRTSGFDPKTSEPIRWMYYDDFLKNGDVCENKKVICLNTLEEFNSINSASEAYNVDNYKIGKVCIKKRKFCGNHPHTNEGLMWIFKDEFDSLNKEQRTELLEKVKKQSIIQKKGVNCYKYKVICLTTGEKFKRMSDAGRKYNIDDRRIYDACKGVLHSAGVHPETKEKLTWLYYSDYVNGRNTPINNIGQKSIICLTTGEVFRKINMAVEAKKINLNSLRKALYGKSEFAGIDEITREPLVWMFYKDYENDIDKIEANKRLKEAASPRLKLRVIREMRKQGLIK